MTQAAPGPISAPQTDLFLFVSEALRGGSWLQMRLARRKVLASHRAPRPDAWILSKQVFLARTLVVCYALMGLGVGACAGLSSEESYWHAIIRPDPRIRRPLKHSNG